MEKRRYTFNYVNLVIGFKVVVCGMWGRSLSGQSLYQAAVVKNKLVFRVGPCQAEISGFKAILVKISGFSQE